MALQPASGAQDLLPREVGANRSICDQLAAIYSRWGYEEVMPPSLERLGTLEAGGAIQSCQVLQVVADEELGLRPEMTASIARAAATRLAAMPRPLRLHYRGSVFQAHKAEQGQRVAEDLQSGVELMGAAGVAGDSELLRLLLDAVGGMALNPGHAPTLLIGHQGLFDLLLEPLPAPQRQNMRNLLGKLDRVGLQQLELEPDLQQHFLSLLDLRGEPSSVLSRLRQLLGQAPLLDELEQLIHSVQAQADRLGIRLQLDPSFHPDFELYDGLMLRMVCLGAHAPVAIASGGRYDRLVQRFSASDQAATGVGFSVMVEAIRQLLQDDGSLPEAELQPAQLVAFAQADQLNAALDQLQQLHNQGQRAELWPTPCTKEDAEAVAAQRGCRGVSWVG